MRFQDKHVPHFRLMEKQREKQLGELKGSIENLLDPQAFKMILFGSRARGDYLDESDVDVAILVRGLTREMKNRILDRVAEIELAYLLPIAALVLSEEEFDHLKKRERRIALDIDSEGIPL
jgi:predicted nucleotidyltransferase